MKIEGTLTKEWTNSFGIVYYMKGSNLYNGRTYKEVESLVENGKLPAGIKKQYMKNVQTVIEAQMNGDGGIVEAALNQNHYFNLNYNN